MTNAEYEHARRTNGIPWKTKPCRECNREKPSDTVFCGVCDECAEEQEKQRLEAKAAWAKQMEAEARLKPWREAPKPDPEVLTGSPQDERLTDKLEKRALILPSDPAALTDMNARPGKESMFSGMSEPGLPPSGRGGNWAVPTFSERCIVAVDLAESGPVIQIPPRCRLCGLDLGLLASMHHADGTHTHNSCAAASCERAYGLGAKL